MMTPWIGRLRRAALGGALAWGLASAAGFFPERGGQLVALAPVTLLPLGLALLPGRELPAGFALASGAVLLAGPCALLASLLAPGPYAAALAAPWLAATLLVALVGLLRLRGRERRWDVHELALDAGMLYLPVGAVWLLASRAGVELLGFREPIVTFTAAHFHYAGFAAPVIVGLLGRSLGEPSRGLLYRGAAGIVILGIPLVAAGIQFSRSIELPAALLLSVGMFGAAVLLVRTGLGALLSGPGAARLGGLLRVLGGLSLVFSMFLAVLFASTGSATRGSAEPLIPYADMANLHGIANALGFSLLSLLGFTLASPERPEAP